MPPAHTHHKDSTDSSVAKSRNCSPWLSVLVPAYEYATGVNRILDALATQRPHGVECIVRDDSRSDGVQDVVMPRIHHQDVACLTYIRNAEPNGAVNNWNALMSMARGEYIVLMHHDEAPLEPDFFAALQHELHVDEGTDVLVLGCMVGKESGMHLRRHMPAAVQSLLLRVMGSGYLLRHNFIGSPSMIVIRRSVCPPFDARLKWLVDVEWMNRGISSGRLSCKVSGRCMVASLQRTGDSITASLGNRVREIECAELAQICTEQDVGGWAVLLQPRTVWNSLLVRLDSTLWVSLKVLVRLIALVTRKRNPFFAACTAS
jgi:glycosyltransferase involved in cell wall biosynthesis